MTCICEFLQIPFDPHMLSPAHADRSAIYSDKNHALVNGTTIVHSRPRPDLLTEEMRKKINRYVCLWRKQFGGTWPSYIGADHCGEERPSAWELAWDHASYKFLRLFDKLAPLAFSVTPLSLWSAYRSLKRRNQTSQASTHNGACV